MENRLLTAAPDPPETVRVTQVFDLRDPQCPVYFVDTSNWPWEARDEE